MIMWVVKTILQGGIPQIKSIYIYCLSGLQTICTMADLLILQRNLSSWIPNVAPHNSRHTRSSNLVKDIYIYQHPPRGGV